MLLEYDRLDYELRVKTVNEKILYEVIIQPYFDPDLNVGDGITITDCLLPLTYNGYSVPAPGTLSFSQGDEGYINIMAEVTDDTTFLIELKEVILHDKEFVDGR